MYEHSFLDVYAKTAEEVLNDINKLVKELEEERKNEIYDEKNISLLDDIINITKTELNVVIDAYNTDLELITIDNINKVIKIANELNMPFKLYVSEGTKYNDNYSDNVSMLFDDETLDIFEEINNYLIENNYCELKFLEDRLNPDLAWNLDDVITANDSVNSIIDYIVKFKFTPFEAVAFIHRIVTKTFEYVEDEEEGLNSRSLVGILITDKIVCVGYATFVKAVIDKLNLKGLSCQTYTGFIESSKGYEEIKKYMYILSGEAHMQNLITINDEKYQISGAYVLDTCWDSKNKWFPSGKGYANFMYPVTDLLCFNEAKFVQHQHSIDDILCQFIENEEKPEDSPIIINNKDNSIPISIDKIYNCLFNLFKIIYSKSSEDEIHNRVNRTIEVSKIVSQDTFTAEATNAIRRENLEEYN